MALNRQKLWYGKVTFRPISLHFPHRQRPRATFVSFFRFFFFLHHFQGLFFFFTLAGSISLADGLIPYFN